MNGMSICIIMVRFMKPKKIKISIIVPIYNVEKYLDRCLISITNQTYNNIEIILIDDESPDACPVMCDEWAKKDNRIVVVHKKNEGLGFARNSGLEIATGDYVGFVDSDDIIDLNTIEECVKRLNKYNYDILHFGFKYIDIYDSVKQEYLPNTPRNEYFENKNILKYFLPHLIQSLPNEQNYNLNISSCMCLINKKIIEDNSWKFVSEKEIISEDIYSLLQLYKNINSVGIISKSFYSYRVNENSLTHKYKEDRFNKVKDMYFKLLELYDDTNIKNHLDYLCLSYSIGCIKNIISSNMLFRNKIEKIRMIINDNEIRSIVSKYIKIESIKRKIYFTFFKLKFVYIVYLLTFIQMKNKIR